MENEVNMALGLEKKIDRERLYLSLQHKLVKLIKPLLREERINEENKRRNEEIAKQYEMLSAYLDNIAKDKEKAFEYVSMNLENIDKRFGICPKEEGLLIKQIVVTFLGTDTMPTRLERCELVVVHTPENVEASVRIVSKASAVARENALKLRQIN